MPLVPPPQYVHAPTIPVIERVVSREQVDRECHLMYPRSKAGRFDACAGFVMIDGKRTCLIWMINDDSLRAHEMAHCNGWPADHSGGIPDRPWGRD